VWTAKALCPQFNQRLSVLLYGMLLKFKLYFHLNPSRNG
jgi:hypothetical protein